MAKVITHSVEPSPPPPKTYDICGLTENEMKLIINLLGQTSGTRAWKLWRALPSDLMSTDYFETNNVMRPKDEK